MSVPTNISALTARDLGTLPVTIIEDVTDAPTGDGLNEVWFKYTAQGTEVQIGVLAFAALGHNYLPEIIVWTGPASAPTPYPSGGDAFQIDATQAGISVPVNAGTTYYFQVLNAGSAPPGTDLVLSASTAVVMDTPAGSILVPDDTDGFNAVNLNATTGEVLRYIPLLANGDWGVVTSGGVMAFDNPSPDYFALYSPQMLLLRTGYGTAQDLAQITTDGAHTFYLAHSASLAAVKTISTMSDTGVVSGTTWTLPSDSIAGVRSFAMGVSPDNTILYYAKAGTPAAAIHRYDLIGNAPLSDLAGGISGSFPKQDLLVLTDGTVVIGYFHSSGPDNFIKHYAADGTVLNTYDTSIAPQNNRLFHAADNPNSFWSWYYPDGLGGIGATGRFSNIKVSDGSVLSTFNIDMFTNGINDVSYSTSPPTPNVFGASFSCPALVLRQGGTANVGTGGARGTGPFLGPATPPFTTATFPVRRLRQTAHLSDEQVWLFFSKFQLDCQVGVGLNAGQGSDPQVMLSWSDDGGHTWSPERWMSAGKQGEYTRRVIWRRLGRSRDRVWRIVVSDAVAWRLLTAYVDVAKGTS